MEKVYSTDEYNYTTYETLIEELKNDFVPGQEVGVYVGNMVQLTHGDFVNVDALLEVMGEHAFDAVDDLADEYMRDLTSEQKAALKGAIVKWFNKNIPQPEFFGVRNVVVEKIVVPGDDE